MISFLSLLIKKKSRRSPSSWEGRLKAGDNLGSSVHGEGGQRWWFWLSSWRPHGKEDQLRNVYRLLLSNSSPHEEVITIYVQSLELAWPGKMNWLSPLKQEGKSSSSSLAPTADKRAVRTLSCSACSKRILEPPSGCTSKTSTTSATGPIYNARREGWPLHEGQRYPQSQLELHPKTRQDNRVK